MRSAERAIKSADLAIAGAFDTIARARGRISEKARETGRDPDEAWPRFQDELAALSRSLRNLQSDSDAQKEMLDAISRRRPGRIFRDRLKDGSEGPEMVVVPSGSISSRNGSKALLVVDETVILSSVAGSPRKAN